MTMPHVNSGGSDDFFSNDEVKSYKYEGEEEKKSSDNLSEDKLGLVTEEEVKGGYTGNEKSDRRAEDGKAVQSQGDRDVPPFGFLPGYPPYHNGATPPNSMPPGSIPPPYLFWVQGSKLPMLQSPLGVMVGSYNDSPFTSPPPAHMGIPPITIDPKTGLPRHVYPYPSPSGQFPPSLYPDVQWQRPPGYPISSGALGGPYPPPLLNSTARYPAGLLPPGIPHPGLPHPFMSGPKQEVSQDGHRHGFQEGQPDVPEKKKQPHIKKPLNAFMLFMKEQRAKVVAECTLKESAAINQILGRRWHSLDRSEQAKYYEMARKEKELHLQLYPGWSARDNYATHNKKKKRRKELGPGEKGMTPEDRYLDNPAFGDCTQSKKCRARFGMDQQKHWCKPCRRKKKCIRVYEDGTEPYSDGEDDPLSDGVATGDSFHDSDSMLGSPTHSSTSEDVFSTPHKARLKSVASPLVHDSGRSSQDLSDIDMTICDNNITPVQKSPFSFSKSEKYLSSPWHIPMGSPASSVKSFGSSRGSYSIDSLAISAATPDPQPTRDLDFTNGLSPLSSPGMASPLNTSQQDSPRFGLSTFTEDINKNLSPKKSKSSGLNNSFSISTLSVSAVTPSRVHVT